MPGYSYGKAMPKKKTKAKVTVRKKKPVKKKQ